MNQHASKKGFTLIELIVTLAIVIVIALVSILSLTGRRNLADLNNTSSQIIALLHEAQSRSMSGETGQAWGVYFENSTGTAPFYVLFQGVYSTTSTSGSRYRLPADVSFVTSSIASGASTTITFPFISGVPAVSSTITMKLNNGTSTTIVVNGLSGLIGFGSPGLTGFLASAWSSTTAFGGGEGVKTSAVIYNNYIYVIEHATAQYALPNADGSISNWSSTSAFPANYGAHQQSNIAYGGYMYAIGGFAAIGTRTSTVMYAPVNATGSLGNWTSTTAMPAARNQMPSVINNGYLYVFGGGTASGAATTSVMYAQINGNGTLGNWTNTTPLAFLRFNESAVGVNGYVYLLGGDNEQVGAVTTTVSYAKFNADHTLGSWSTTTALPYGVVSPGWGTTYGGYIYFMGGAPTTAGTNPTTTVIFAAANSDGTLGPWQYTTALPSGLGLQGVVAENGYLYSIGGATNTVSGTPTSTVNFAQIH